MLQLLVVLFFAFSAASSLDGTYMLTKCAGGLSCGGIWPKHVKVAFTSANFTAVDVSGQLPPAYGSIDLKTGALEVENSNVSCVGVAQTFGSVSAVFSCVLHPTYPFDVIYTCTDGFCLSDVHAAKVY